MNNRRGHGQIRRSQVITTYGPGALIDLPRDSAIVGGLEKWPREGDLEPIDEPRLARKLQTLRLPLPMPPESKCEGLGCGVFQSGSSSKRLQRLANANGLGGWSIAGHLMRRRCDLRASRS